jgi:hypothetical protein
LPEWAEQVQRVVDVVAGENLSRGGLKRDLAMGENLAHQRVLDVAKEKRKAEIDLGSVFSLAINQDLE